MVPVESIIRYIREVKQSISQPVTVADNYDWWAKHGGELAKELDFVSVRVRMRRSKNVILTRLSHQIELFTLPRSPTNTDKLIDWGRLKVNISRALLHDFHSGGSFDFKQPAS